jgi:hypothetical protein
MSRCAGRLDGLRDASPEREWQMGSLNMVTQSLTAATMVLLLGTGAAAQETAPKPKEAAPGPVEQTTQARPQERPGQPLNIRLDLTITDDIAPGRSDKRTVTMIVGDGQSGNIRSTGNQVQARLFVDANPQLLSNGQVRLNLGIEYNPRQPVVDKEPAQGGFAVMHMGQPTGGSSLIQRITLVLQPDKPLVISQAPDPVSDRKISVEVRATLLK